MKRFGFVIAAFSVLAGCATPATTDAPAASSPPAVAQPAPAPAAPSPAAPAAPAQTAVNGAVVLQNECSSCHAADLVAGFRKTRADWEVTLDSMISRGATLSDAEYAALTDYLVANYGAR